MKVVHTVSCELIICHEINHSSRVILIIPRFKDTTQYMASSGLDPRKIA
jgi:hypothetical protein